MVVEPKQLPRTRPAVFAGPFLVEIEEQNEYVPHGVASLILRVQGFGLPPVVVEQLENTNAPCTILEAVDSTGRDLIDTGKTFHRQRVWKKFTDAFERTQDVHLKGLLKDVKAIKALRGKVAVALPVRIEEVRFDSLKNNSTQKIGDGEVKLNNVWSSSMRYNNKSVPQMSFRLEFVGIQPRQVKVLAYDAGKNLMGLSPTGYSWSGNSGNAGFTVMGTPASLVVKILRFENVDYEFRFDDVPLRKADQMPEKLTPARFPGSAPIKVDFVRMTKDGFLTRAQLRITNLSDKPIRALELRADYLDSAGKEISKANHLEHREEAKENAKEMPLIVGAKETATRDVMAAFAPANLQGMRITPQVITFADGSKWQAKPAGK
jgi:hypothetical protein